ncbi:winged helix DNA-binding domain-containing protein [Isoptericola sp. BMS4]|uniref:winged helix DNA-binding domain-containing protein n=1 Tax=Isoptericola sp. BMS4 TaxID=2527875 RepID=UPI001423E27D|nr:winged helix DNA-binding domain-containing protein [Isoptericola sp. BMS4]
MSTAPRRGADRALVRAARLEATGLRAPDRVGVPDVVEGLLAVQAQELQPALWGLSRRVAPEAGPVRRDATNRALADGELLRTHVLRPTWHLVRPADARWLLASTRPRVEKLMASTERQWRLDDLTPGVDAVAAAVADGARTRAEIRDELLARGVLDPGAPGLAFTNVLMHAELEQLVISGPPPADHPYQHQSYAAFDDRVPAGYGPLGERFDAEDAVVELWRRYLPGRAFATVNDLRLWSDVTVRDLRRALAVLVDQGEVVEVDGAGDLEGLRLVATAATAERWLDDDGQRGAPAAGGSSVVDLLQAYDELLMSYRETRHVVLDPALPPTDRAGAFVHAAAVDGVVAGRWRWPTAAPRDGVPDVEVQWSRTPAPAEEAALARTVEDLRDYLAGTTAATEAGPPAGHGTSA